MVKFLLILGGLCDLIAGAASVETIIMGEWQKFWRSPMSAIDYAGLNSRFGIPGQVTFKEGPGGLAIVEVVNNQATATIALQGAHVMTWTPHGQKPVIWLSRAAKFSSGKSIRGGIPVCWPWFGPHATEPSFPVHGFARTTLWDVIETQELTDGTTRLELRLVQNEATLKQWPYASELLLIITIGAGLEIELVTQNTGESAIAIGEALHTYFEVSDVRRVTVRGLEGHPYIDKVDGGKHKQQTGPVTISAEVDRIYLDSTADCLIDDPLWTRCIRISKRGSHSTVIWNPWIEKTIKMGDLGEDGYLNMICVESTNAADDVVTIAVGAEHRLWVRYTVEALS